MFDFNTMVDRSKTDSAKWFKYKGRDIIPMWVADMDFKAPPAVIHALQNRVQHAVFGYAMPHRELTKAIVSYLDRTYDWQIIPKWIVWLPGLVTGLNAACQSAGRPGDSVLTTIPIYPPFLTAPKFSQRKLKTTRLSFVRDKWRLNFDHIEDIIDESTALVLLCNPHNPTGRVFDKQELLQLADICLKNDIIICSDEIHCDLVLDERCRHIPIATLSPEIAKRTITLMAPSKTYNIPGLGCAYAIVPDDTMRRRFKQVMSGIVPHVNALGMVAAQAAYTHGQSWLQELIVYLRNNRNLVSQRIKETPMLKMGPVEATYLAWIDAREIGFPDLNQWFENAGVGISDGRQFDGNGYIRLNFGCPRALLEKALDRISSAIEKLKG